MASDPLTPVPRWCTSCGGTLDSVETPCPTCGAPAGSFTSRPTEDSARSPGPLPDDPAFRARLAAALGTDFELRALIGRGGFGAVYAAWDRKLEREVAIKSVRPDLLAAGTSLERFAREARAAAKLRHPNILPVYTVGEAQGLAYMVMPLVRGESLHARLSREKVLPVEEVRRILSEAASALATAHDAGIVHRDIKPENILLEGPERRVLIMDFGIAKAIAASEPGLTGTGSIIGTPQYMSPEQATGESEVGPASDLYSLGVTGFQMLTGRLPFEATRIEQLIYLHVTTEPPNVRDLRSEVPEGLSATIARSLAKSPSRRWSSGSAFSAALREEPRALPPPRSRWVVGGVAVVALLIVGSAFLWMWAQMGSRVVPTPPLRQVTFSGEADWAALSPDGRYLSFTSDSKHWLLDLTNDSLRTLGTILSRVPRASWSNDGGHLFLPDSNTSSFRRIDSRRHDPPVSVTAQTAAEAAAHGSFGPVAFMGARDTLILYSIREGHGISRAVPNAGYVAAPSISPDGEWVAFWHKPDTLAARIAVTRAAGADPSIHALDRAGMCCLGPLWSNDGATLYAVGDSGGVWRFDLDLIGAPRVVRRTTLLAGVVATGWDLAKRTNRIAMTLGRFEHTTFAQRVTRTGVAGTPVELRTGSFDPETIVALDSGRRTLFVGTRNGSAEIYRSDGADRPPVQLTRLGARWINIEDISTDGRLAVLTLDSSGSRQLWVVDRNTGRGRKLLQPTADLSCGAWGPSTEHIYQVSRRRDPVSTIAITRLAVATGVFDTLIPPSKATEWISGCPSPSPDGDFIAVEESHAGRRDSILIIRIQDLSSRAIPSTGSLIDWIAPNTLLLLRDSSLVALDFDGRSRPLGSTPGPCWSFYFEGGEFTCTLIRRVTDIWIADDFDPYFDD